MEQEETHYQMVRSHAQLDTFLRKYFRIMAIVQLLIGILFLLDYYLPQQQKVVTILNKKFEKTESRRSIHTSQIYYFEKSYAEIPDEDLWRENNIGSKAIVYVTPIFRHSRKILVNEVMYETSFSFIKWYILPIMLMTMLFIYAFPRPRYRDLLYTLMSFSHFIFILLIYDFFFNGIIAREAVVLSLQ